MVPINGTTVPDNCFTTRFRRMTTRSENRRSRYSWSDVRCSLRKQSGATGRGGERGECESGKGRRGKRADGGRRNTARAIIVSSFVCVRDRAFPPNVARDQFPFPSPPLYSPLARQDSSMIPRFDPGITRGEFSARVIIIARVEL